MSHLQRLRAQLRKAGSTQEQAKKVLKDTEDNQKLMAETMKKLNIV